MAVARSEEWTDGRSKPMSEEDKDYTFSRFPVAPGRIEERRVRRPWGAGATGG